MTLLKHVTSPQGNANFLPALVHLICYTPTFIQGVVTRIENRCVIKQRHVLATFYFVLVFNRTIADASAIKNVTVAGQYPVALFIRKALWKPTFSVFIKMMS